MTIEALQTSCARVASVAEGGRWPLFVIEPQASAEVTLTTTALSLRGLEQDYVVVVKASLDGRRLPDHYAAMTFHVADLLKANPAELRIYEAPDDGQPLHRAITLYTYHDPREFPEPEVRVTGSEHIHANVSRSPVAMGSRRPARATTVLTGPWSYGRSPKSPLAARSTPASSRRRMGS